MSEKPKSLQTQLQLKSLHNFFDKEEKKEKLQDTQQRYLLPKSDHYHRSQYESSYAEIQRQRQVQWGEQKKNQILLKKSLLAQIQQPNYDFKDFYAISMRLINIVYQQGDFAYDVTNNHSILYSFKNDVPQHHKIMNKSGTQIVRENHELFDRNQAMLFDLFRSKTQIYFQLYKEEIKLKIKEKRYRITTGQFGHYFREDKCVHEAVLMEWYHTPQLQMDVDAVQGHGLQLLSDELIHLPTPPFIQQVPRSTQRRLNLYYIIREIILESLDFLHFQSCGRQVLFHPDEVTEEEPSLRLRKLYSGVRGEECVDTEVVQQKATAIRMHEKKIKTLLNKIQKQRKQPKNQNPNIFLSVEAAMEIKIKLFSNDGQSTTKQIQDFGDVQSGPFLKQVGKSKQYHECWLELRGFHVSWFHLDKKFRGSDVLDEVAIVDEQIRPGEWHYQVKLASRTLCMKIDNGLVGSHWRSLLANQVAYKTYLNGLMFANRLSCTHNLHLRVSSRGADYVDESSLVNANLVDYFNNTECDILDLSGDALELVMPMMVVRHHMASYTNQLGRVVGDSLLHHHHLKVLNLRGSMCGPLFLSQIFRAMLDERLQMRLRRLELAHNVMNQQCVEGLVSYLHNQNSFHVTELLLNDVKLGDELFEVLMQGVTQRYAQNWQTHDLQMLRLLSIERIGISDRGVGSLMNSLERVIEQIVNAVDAWVVPQDCVNGLEHAADLNELACNLKRQMGIITYRSLGTLKGLFRMHQYKQWGQELVLKVLALTINMSHNDCGDASLSAVSHLVMRYDCFVDLEMAHLKHTTGLGLLALMKSLGESLNLLTLDLSGASVDPDTLVYLLLFICDNFSLRRVKLTLPRLDSTKFKDQLSRIDMSHIIAMSLHID